MAPQSVQIHLSWEAAGMVVSTPLPSKNQSLAEPVNCQLVWLWPVEILKVAVSLALVVQMMDSAIQWINDYLLDKYLRKWFEPRNNTP